MSRFFDTAKLRESYHADMRHVNWRKKIKLLLRAYPSLKTVEHIDHKSCDHDLRHNTHKDDRQQNVANG